MFARFEAALLVVCALYAQAPGREESPLAVASRVLAMKNASADQLIEADAYIRAHSHRLTGLLRFRWLQILERALESKELHDVGAARYQKWAESNAVIEYFEPDAAWNIRQEEYWKLYAANKTAGWAEGLAWYASTRKFPRDECYAECLLSWLIERPLQYWSRYPEGVHIESALKEADRIARLATREACDRTNRELFQQTYVPTRVIARVRGSLDKVTSPAQSPLLRTLDRIEVKCRR